MNLLLNWRWTDNRTQVHDHSSTYAFWTYWGQIGREEKFLNEADGQLRFMSVWWFLLLYALNALFWFSFIFCMSLGGCCSDSQIWKQTQQAHLYSNRNILPIPQYHIKNVWRYNIQLENKCLRSHWKYVIQNPNSNLKQTFSRFYFWIYF